MNKGINVLNVPFLSVNHFLCKKHVLNTFQNRFTHYDIIIIMFKARRYHQSWHFEPKNVLIRSYDVIKL